MKRILFFTAMLYCLHATGQRSNHDLPLPRLKDVSMVVVRRTSFAPPPKYKFGKDNDTDSYYLIGRDGYATTEYYYNYGVRAGKHTYKYQDGKLIKMSYYSMAKGHPVLLPLREDSLIYSSGYAWHYNSNGKIILEQNFKLTPPLQNMEDKYEYDAADELVSRRHYLYGVPGPDGVGYDPSYDSTFYRREGDTVYATRYKKGEQTIGHYYQRTTTAPKRYEFYEQSPDGKHFNHETAAYDKQGRILTETTRSDYRAVQADGTVLRADSVVHLYDKQGRPKTTEYYAEGIKRWQLDYSYIR